MLVAVYIVYCVVDQLWPGQWLMIDMMMRWGGGGGRWHQAAVNWSDCRDHCRLQVRRAVLQCCRLSVTSGTQTSRDGEGNI